MDIVNTHGAGFAFPSQTIYLARDDKPDPEKMRTATEKMAALRALPPDDQAGEAESPESGTNFEARSEDDSDHEGKGGGLPALFRRFRLRFRARLRGRRALAPRERACGRRP